MSVTLKELKEKCKKFDELEKRGSFYNMARNLLIKGYEIEAYILILATWNFARFRYFVTNFDLKDFKEKIKVDWEPIFNDLKNEKLQLADFNKIGDKVKELYDSISQFMGIGYTGASKTMHLKNPELFVMWDIRIREEIYKLGKSPEDYLKFHKQIQQKFKNIKWDDKKKTFAKAIDEYNYVDIYLANLNKIKNVLKDIEPNTQVSLKHLTKLTRFSQSLTRRYMKTVPKSNPELGEYNENEKVFIKHTSTIPVK